MKKSLHISVLIDNPQSWFHKFKLDLARVLKRFDRSPRFIAKSCAIQCGDILFILSCEHLLKKEALALHKNNIVVHASNLPKGRGWSPWTWQVELGKKSIPLTLFEAALGCDTGDYYLKDSIDLDGSELIEEIRDKLGAKVIEMIEQFLEKYPLKPIPQKGKPTYFRKRTPKDNRLDINQTIARQFNKLRVCDNERYPAHFEYKKNKYVLKIFKEK